MKGRWICEGSKQNNISLCLCVCSLCLCGCVCARACSVTGPDTQINQTVFWFSNEYCQESPVRQIPVKITENMFCAGSSLESAHTCKVSLFPLPLLSFAWETVLGSTYLPSPNPVSYLHVQEQIKVNEVQEGISILLPIMSELRCQGGNISGCPHFFIAASDVA